MTRQQQLDACAVVEVDCTLHGGYIDRATMSMCAVTALANAAGYNLVEDTAVTIGRMLPKITERFGLDSVQCEQIMQINDSYCELQARRKAVRNKILSFPVTG